MKEEMTDQEAEDLAAESRGAFEPDGFRPHTASPVGEYADGCQCEACEEWDRKHHRFERQ